MRRNPTIYIIPTVTNIIHHKNKPYHFLPISPAISSQNLAIKISFSDNPFGRCVVHVIFTSL